MLIWWSMSENQTNDSQSVADDELESATGGAFLELNRTNIEIKTVVISNNQAGDNITIDD